MERQPCVYILASDRNGTVYLGVTSNLMQRLYQLGKPGERAGEKIAGLRR